MSNTSGRDWPDARRAARSLEALGWSDAAISRALAVSDRTLRNWRRDLFESRVPDVPCHQIAILAGRGADR